MNTLPLSEVKAKLSELVKRVAATDEAVTVTRRGRAVAVLVSHEEFEAWTETLAVQSDRALMREIRSGLRALRNARKRYTPHELLRD